MEILGKLNTPIFIAESLKNQSKLFKLGEEL